MDWCRLHSGYYRDPALIRAGEAAELLFLRMLAYCAETETGGRVPKAALPMLTPTRGKTRAAALVREQLLIDDGDDYVVRSWSRIQEAHDSEADRRRKARDKKRRQRDTDRDDSGDSDGDTTGSVPGTVPGTVLGTSPGRPRRIEVEVEVEIPLPSPPVARDEQGPIPHPAEQVRAARSAAGLTLDGWTDTACTHAVNAVRDQAVARQADQATAWAALTVIARMPDTSHPGRLTHKLDDALAEVVRMRRDAGNARAGAAILTEIATARQTATDPTQVPAWAETRAAFAAKQKRASA